MSDAIILVQNDRVYWVKPHGNIAVEKTFLLSPDQYFMGIRLILIITDQV